jgi:hypothetical protein
LPRRVWEPTGRRLLTHAAAVTGLVAANLYIVAFAISWGPLMWVLLGEMFPNRMRGAALLVTGATNWIMNFVVSVTFLPLLNAAGLASAYASLVPAAPQRSIREMPLHPGRRGIGHRLFRFGPLRLC